MTQRTVFWAQPYRNTRIPSKNRKAMLKKCTKSAILVWLTAIGLSHGQLLDPANWEVKVKNGTVQIGKEAEVCFTVQLNKGWYIYSPDQDADLGPVPTSFELINGKDFKIVGKPIPMKVIDKYDDVWEGTVRIIKESGGGFRQRIKVLEANPTIRGTISYTVCSEETGQCIFPDDDFEITIKTTDR